MIFTEKQFKQFNEMLVELRVSDGFLNNVYPNKAIVDIPKGGCTTIRKLDRNGEIMAIQKYLIEECNRIYNEEGEVDKLRPLMDAWVGYEEEKLTYLKIEALPNKNRKG